MDLSWIGAAKSLTSPLLQPIFVPVLYLMLQSLGMILNVWTTFDRVQDEKDFHKSLYPASYDFIIVGAGSAGSLLANRLSRHHTVLLMEAGGEPNPLQFVPGFGLFLINYPEVDWQHRSVTQKYGSLISNNGQSSWSTGLGLGGTGNLNLMIHLRGHRKDFDNWANIVGDPSWNWENVLPFFKSYENYHFRGDHVYHGYKGPLRIEIPNHIGNAHAFVRAGMELGYPNVDLNAPHAEGFDVIRYPIKNGVRQAPYKAFLEPIRNRPSLTIMKYARVNRILFHNGNEAYGIEYERHGRVYACHATKEVIISAGSVGTPKLLMLSGVGPGAHLESLNIPVIADLPVGENLQDHLGAYLGPFFIREGLSTYIDRDLTISQFAKWLALGKGRLSSTGCDASGVLSSEYAKQRGESDWPDLHLFLYTFTNFRYGPELMARAFNFKLDEVRRYFEGSVGRDSLYIIVSGARPFSRGYIRLGGSSASDRPIIEPNYLSDEHDTDIKVLIEGVKKALFMMENTTAGGVELGARFTSNLLPGCEHLPFRTDVYWDCFIRRFSATLHHPVGTAAMGSVVDSELRVFGVRNLRVVDASVQPTVVVTNTQASTLMIAEKASDMILRHWNFLYPDCIGPTVGRKKSPLGSLLGIFKKKNKNGCYYYNKWLHKKREQETLNGIISLVSNDTGTLVPPGFVLVPPPDSNSPQLISEVVHHEPPMVIQHEPVVLVEVPPEPQHVILPPGPPPPSFSASPLLPSPRVPQASSQYPQPIPIPYNLIVPQSSIETGGFKPIISENEIDDEPEMEQENTEDNQVTIKKPAKAPTVLEPSPVKFTRRRLKVEKTNSKLPVTETRKKLKTGKSLDEVQDEKENENQVQTEFEYYDVETFPLEFKPSKLITSEKLSVQEELKPFIPSLKILVNPKIIIREKKKN